MSRTRAFTRVITVAAVLVASASCGDVVRDGRSPVYLVIDSLQAAPGNRLTFSTAALLSDVVTVVATRPTVFDDIGRAVFHAPLRDITSVTGPTTNNEVTITRYRVVYRRSDGRNTAGIDVPYPIDGAATSTVPPNGDVTLDFELVRHVAKGESPLLQLRDSRSVITTLADVTFYGTDRVGHAISVTGTIQVNFGDFADQ